MTATPKVSTPRPRCERCGRETRRTGTRAGKGIYTCVDATCPDAFKVTYLRQSSR